MTRAVYILHMYYCISLSHFVFHITTTSVPATISRISEEDINVAYFMWAIVTQISDFIWGAGKNSMLIRILLKDWFGS